MKVKTKTIEAIAEAVADLQPNRESVSDAYDWLSVLRDEMSFQDGLEADTALLDEVLVGLVLFLIAVSAL
jgi:hypothetical protein